MENIIDKIRGAVLAGLSQKETEAMLGHTLSEDEANEYVKTKAQIKVKNAMDKQKASQQPQKKTTSQISFGITNNLTPKLPPLEKRYTKKQIQECIEKHYGVVTRICNELDCTYTQFYKAIKQLNLQEYLTDAKKNLVSLAENTLLEALASVDEKTRVDVAKYILKTQGKVFGWNDGPQIAQQINVQGEVSIKEIFGIND